jgi:Flp pilus assembly protein TadD
MTNKPAPHTTAWQTLRQSPIQAGAWLELAADYRDRNLRWQASYAARQALRCDARLQPKLNALDIGAWQDAATGDALLGRATLPEAAAFAAAFASAVKQNPDDWLSWLYLARLQEFPGVTKHQEEAQENALKKAESQEIIAGETLHWLGVWRLNAGDAKGAVSALSGLLNIRPVRYGSMMYLGEALLHTGNIAAAEKAFSRASQSPNPDFLTNLSARVYAHNYWQEAIQILTKALDLRPGGSVVARYAAPDRPELGKRWFERCPVRLGRRPGRGQGSRNRRDAHRL